MDGMRFRKLDPVPFSGLFQEAAAFPSASELDGFGSGLTILAACKTEICVEECNFKASARFVAIGRSRILFRLISDECKV